MRTLSNGDFLTTRCNGPGKQSLSFFSAEFARPIISHSPAPPLSSDVRSLENVLFIGKELLYYSRMSKYSFTDYFENDVLRKRPYLKKEWCLRVVENPIRVEPQEHNRFRFWGEIEELEGRYLRVITLSDK